MAIILIVTIAAAECTFDNKRKVSPEQKMKAYEEVEVHFH
jgi:hypothetical protein